MARDDISRGEAERLRALGGDDRVAATFDVLAGKGVLWVWGDEFDTLFTEDARRTTLLPIWPYATVAQLENEEDAEPGEHPIAIPVDEFLKEWLPQLEEDDADIAIFPVDGHNAGQLTLKEFRAKLN
ncbi:hypothetical protein GCM10010435_48080 [Winogradskya consettensis]|uniref:DUF2750 domain-containing protein n=1 Tax=Winogradskya consettensis TaxID=113560 RepID=A0A919SJ35_9ACTN|nr:DUF2750 domain-containing protein [Actinoplanes consettensis]GIM72976.1 hypothetical protein Aco04nite_33010 [Actinoplanes consettensis]